MIEVRFILFSNRVLSQRVDGRKADQIDGKEATYNVWDLGRLFRFVAEVDRPEEIVVDLAKDIGGPVPALPAYMDDA